MLPPGVFLLALWSLAMVSRIMPMTPFKSEDVSVYALFIAIGISGISLVICAPLVAAQLAPRPTQYLPRWLIIVLLSFPVFIAQLALMIGSCFTAIPFVARF